MYLPAGYLEFPAHWPPGHPIEADWSYLATASGMHRVLPDGRIDLLVHFQITADAQISDLQFIIAGPSTRYFDVPVQPGAAFIGVRFRAGWGGACLGVQPAALCDSTLTGAAVAERLGPYAAQLLQAQDIATLHSTLRHAADALAATAQASASAQTLEAIDLLHIAGGRLPIAELARRAASSERSLRRAMQQAVGLPVKTLASILRFQRTVRLLRADPTLSLSAAATEGGYSDHAHMAREFRRFGGFSPSERSILAHGDLPL